MRDRLVGQTRQQSAQRLAFAAQVVGDVDRGVFPSQAREQAHGPEAGHIHRHALLTSVVAKRFPGKIPNLLACAVGFDGLGFGGFVVVDDFRGANRNMADFDRPDSAGAVGLGVDVVGALGDVDRAVFLLGAVEAELDFESFRNAGFLLLGELKNLGNVARKSTRHDGSPITAYLIP